MEMKFVIEAQGSSEGQPLRICVSGGRLEVLGFAPGKKVAIEEAYGKLSICLLEVFEEAQSVVPVPVAQVVPVQPVPVVTPIPAPVEAPVQSVQPVPVQLPQPEAKPAEAVVPAGQPGQSLFQQLVALRKQISLEAKVPPYIIFHDSTLKEMSLSLPSSLEALSGVQGVGKAKLEKYGSRFVEVIRRHAQEVAS